MPLWFTAICCTVFKIILCITMYCDSHRLAVLCLKLPFLPGWLTAACWTMFETIIYMPWRVESSLCVPMWSLPTCITVFETILSNVIAINSEQLYSFWYIPSSLLCHYNEKPLACLKLPRFSTTYFTLFETIRSVLLWCTGLVEVWFWDSPVCTGVIHSD